MAIHILWYAPLVAWVLEHTGLCERSIHEEWTSVELYNRHEFFYETLIVSIVTYLSGIIPRAILLDREKLFELAANNAGTNCVLFSQNATRTLNHLSTCIPPPTTHANKSPNQGTMVLLRFLFDFALPWLAMRQGIRCNSGDTLDRMWQITLAWFRACGKTNYAPMAVDVLYVNSSLSAPLCSIWREQRTMSLRGNTGCMIPYDQGNEQMNKEVKCGLGAAVAAHLINQYILMLNGIRHIEARLMAIFGAVNENEVGDEDEKESYYEEATRTEYTRTEEKDIDAIVQALTFSFGSTLHDLFKPRTTNPFRKGAGVPWTRVDEQSADMNEYIKKHLANPFDVHPA